MITDSVRHYLDTNHIRYVTIEHSPAYTAQEIAASAHIRGKDMAKTVIVKVADKLPMVVLPASRRVHIDELQRITGSDDVRLAHEYEFERQFPDCEPGAMPPFGNLYGLDVYVDPDLAKDEAIAFNAGSHTELVSMKYGDFENLVHPKLLLKSDA